MVRSRRAWFGAVVVVFACSLASGCSSARPDLRSHDTAGAGNDAEPASAGAHSSSGGTRASGPSIADGGASQAAAAGSGGASAVEPSAGGSNSGGTNSSGVRRVFYLDVQGSVRVFDEDKPTPRTLLSSAGKGPDGIAVDVAGGHVYWTTMGVPADNDGSLLRSELDGSNVTTIVPTGGAYTPKQLKLDLAARQLYWSDREGMRVQRVDIDGSGLETLVTVATGDAARKDAENWCVGLALDLTNGFFYWTQKGPDNGKVGSIRRAHLQMPNGETASTRTDIEILIEQLPEPVDLDLDVAGGQMYWTDRGDDTVSRAPIEVPAGKTAATRSDRQILVRGVREAIGVTLDLERGHVYYTSGASGRVGRANLDGSDAVDLVTGTGALTGIAVVPSGH